MQDYYKLVNSEGGVDGWTVRGDEIDNQYKVPPAIEAYERQKQMGVLLMTLYGTPQTVALNQRLEQDKMPTTSPGFGIAAAADGTRYPYLFPIAATYWSQAAGAVKFAKDKLGGSLKGKKIAYVYYDNPAGKEPLPIIDALQKSEGFELRTFAVPPPGVEMGAQILDITQRYHPDFIIAHLFGRSPSVMIKGLKGAGYPLSKVIGLVWASAEADILAAGGWGVAEGYNTLQFAGAGDDYPVRQQIKAMYKKEGKDPPKEMDDTVIYNRGLLAGGDPGRGAQKRAEDQRRPEADAASRSRTASNRSTTSRWAASSRHCRSPRPITKAAAGCRSSRSMTASSSRRPTGSAPIAMSSKMRSRPRNSHGRRRPVPMPGLLPRFLPSLPLGAEQGIC